MRIYIPPISVTEDARGICTVEKTEFEINVKVGAVAPEGAGDSPHKALPLRFFDFGLEGRAGTTYL